jgi:hypothetical protein
MMDHFVVQYRPGGMSLSHSAWWIAERRVYGGRLLDIPVKYLRRADYE